MRKGIKRFVVVVLAALFLVWRQEPRLGLIVLAQPPSNQYQLDTDGPQSVALGKRLWQERKYDEAAAALWRAVILHSSTPPAQTYDVQEVFQLFMQCYMVQDRLADGFAFVSLESFQRGQDEMGHNYLRQALAVDPNNPAALEVQEAFGNVGDTGGGVASSSSLSSPSQSAASSNEKSNEQKDIYYGKTPEDLYEIASDFFAKKDYETCADVFELSCSRSRRTLGPSCANAIYCRSMIVDWGFNGTQFDKDMKEIARLTEEEIRDFKVIRADGSAAWKRATSIHPHMMLGYPVDPLLKKEVTESVAFLDELMARADQRDPQTGDIPKLPPDLPFSIDHRPYVEEVSTNPNFKLRIGFVGSGFSSKAVLYLSQDMFRFFDKSRFEVHVFSFGPPDNPLFIHHGMRGVDWRERVKANVDRFHDCQSMKMDHIKAARYIHDQVIHVLIEWDGFARQGESKQHRDAFSEYMCYKKS